MKKAISVQHVSKDYRLYDNQRALLKELVLKIPSHNVKRALNDVSFDVYEGETYGILGGNGSGKSTVLSIIAGTTTPTSGKVITKGKVSLLNVGAGLVNSYTGYENIYYKCSLMGLSRHEIEERLDSIIEFSELGEYLKQPIKKYSSGMRSKLGFSIAIHVEPEILIVDEALAVGDKRFQDKCHKKIAEIKEKGTTILYVSHNHGQVKKICDRACWIYQGEVLIIGDAAKVSDIYDSFMSKKKKIKQIKQELAEGKYELS